MLKTIFNNAMDFVKNKFRLLIEYALIGVLVATAGLSFTLWLQREKVQKELDDTKVTVAQNYGRINSLEAVNDRQEKTIATLNDLREQDSKSLTNLLSDYAKLTGHDTAVRSKIAELEKRNAKVQNYMDQPVPLELKCVLEDHTCSESGNQNSH